MLQRRTQARDTELLCVLVFPCCKVNSGSICHFLLLKYACWVFCSDILKSKNINFCAKFSFSLLIILFGLRYSMTSDSGGSHLIADYLASPMFDSLHTRTPRERSISLLARPASGPGRRISSGSGPSIISSCKVLWPIRREYYGTVSDQSQALTCDKNDSELQNQWSVKLSEPSQWRFLKPILSLIVKMFN